MARNIILLVAIFLAEMLFTVSTVQARLGWTLAQSVEMYGPYKFAAKDVPGYLPGMQYAFIDKAADANHPKLDCIVESYKDGKVGMIAYCNLTIPNSG
jgi:hypothetical protein